MATGDIKVTEGGGKNVATYTITEDAETKAIQRVGINDSSGNEVLTAAQVTSLLGYVDGLETLIGATNTKLDTLHSDLGTTLAGYVDGLETLSTTTNTKLDTLHTDMTAATPAGTNLIGRVSASPETGTVYNGITALTPKHAKISVSSSGVNTIVAAVTSKIIRVLSWDLSPNAAVNAKWQSHTAGDITGLYYMAGQGNGHARNFNPAGWFETTAGEALDLNLSGAVAVGGCLTYVEV